MEDSGRLIKLLGVGLAIGILIVGVWMAIVSRKPRPEPGRIEQVTLSREEVSITLNRRGTLTVKIPEGTFQQQWDEDKVAAFFAKFESADFSPFATYSPEEGAYLLTYTTADGEEHSYVLPFLEVSIPEVVEELIEILEEIIESVTPEPTPTPTPTPTPFIQRLTPTPTPTPTQPFYPTPTPTPTADGGEEPLIKLFECEFTDPSEAPDILSQTVCTLIY